MMHPPERHPAWRRRLAVLALAPAVAAAPAAAQPPEEAYRPITAAELYAGIMEGGLASWVRDPAQRTTLSTAMATSYILGVANSAQDSQWCPAAGLGVAAMAATVLDHLADLPQGRQQESAAAVVAEALGKTYPCRP